MSSQKQVHGLGYSNHPPYGTSCCDEASPESLHNLVYLCIARGVPCASRQTTQAWILQGIASTRPINSPPLAMTFQSLGYCYALRSGLFVMSLRCIIIQTSVSRSSCVWTLGPSRVLQRMTSEESSELWFRKDWCESDDTNRFNPCSCSKRICRKRAVDLHLSYAGNENNFGLFRTRP